MKSKKPFLSRELIYTNFRRFWWISVLFVLALFLVSPLVTLTRGTETIPQRGYNIDFDDIFNGTILFVFTVPVFIGVMMFRYMQNPRSMVTIHAMPYTRLRLYVNNIISGLVLLVLPILLNTAFLSIIELGSLGGTFFREGIVLKYLYVSLLTSVSLYIWTIFVGMFTGSSIAQIIFTYILNFLLVGIIAVTQFLLQGVLYGFIMNESSLIDFALVSPIVQTLYMLDYNSSAFTNYLIMNLVICAFMLVTGYFIYKYRNLETAGDVISGKYIKPVFKYGVTVCAMLVGTAYVKAIFSIETVNILIYLLFALIGYVVAEMLLRKSFKILSSYKGFIWFTVVFCIVALGIKVDMFEYESYVPKVEDIECFSLDSYGDFKLSTKENPGYGVMYDEENLQNITKLHEEIIKDREINLANNLHKGSFSISYKLKNGKIIRRRYELDIDRYYDMLNLIYDSKEYKVSTSELFDYTAEDIYSIRIENILLDGTKFVSIDKKDEIEELLNVAKSDILALTVEEKSESINIYRIGFVVKPKEDTKKITTDKYYTVDKAGFISEIFNINAKAVNKFIEEKGYKDILLGTDTIISISVEKDEDEIVSISDPDKINKVMNNIYTSKKG